MGNATGIFNLMRNIGGSAGIAFVTTFVARRAQFHQSVLVTHAAPYDPEAQAALQQAQEMLHHLAPPQPLAAPPPPVAFLYGEVQRQAGMLGIIDAFWILAVLMTLLVLGLFLLKRPIHAPSLTAAH
jgi:DHA2 family multidrug resistance protein